MASRPHFSKLMAFFTRLKPNEKSKQLSNNVRIGAHTYGISSSSQILYAEQADLEIGKFCSIADNLKIMLGGGHRLDLLSTFPFGHIDTFECNFKIANHPTTNGNVSVGNDVWIGSNVTLMSGLRVENGAVIAANSHVIKDIGPYEIWGGNPAVFLRYRVKPELVQRVNALEWWDWCKCKLNHFGNLFCQPLDENLLFELESAKQFTKNCCDCYTANNSF